MLVSLSSFSYTALALVRNEFFESYTPDASFID